MNKGICELCGLETELTLHHLVPVVKCHNKYKTIKNDQNNHIMLCRPCHDAVHAAYTENELRDLYSSKARLAAAPEVKKFVEWRKKHPNFNGHSRLSNTKKSR